LNIAPLFIHSIITCYNGNIAFFWIFLMNELSFSVEREVQN